MSKVYNTLLQEQVTEYLRETGISQAKAAPMMGLSQTALSQWRNNKYDNGSIEEVESKVEEYLATISEKNELSEKSKAFVLADDYVPTSISEDIIWLIKYCQLKKGIGIVYGDSGVGKTKAAEKFAKDNPASTVYFQIDPVKGTLGNVMRILASKLGVPSHGDKLTMVERIKGKLNGTNKVIIIDEAQHLKYLALEQLRNLTEENHYEGYLPITIILIGSTEVYSRMVGKHEVRFAQQFNRVTLPKECSTSEVKRTDIEMLFPYLNDRKMKQELELVHRISRSKLGIRGAMKIYDAAVKNNDVTMSGLQAAAQNSNRRLI